MSTKDEMFDALLDAALKNGETIDSYGAEEGHDVELIQDGSLWLVVEGIDKDDQVELYLDETEAREAFAEAKAEIEKEEAEE